MTNFRIIAKLRPKSPLVLGLCGLLGPPVFLVSAGPRFRPESPFSHLLQGKTATRMAGRTITEGEINQGAQNT